MNEKLIMNGLTNKSKSFQNSMVIETRLSDVYVTVMNTYYSKQKPTITHYFKLKGCVRYIFASLCFKLKESICHTRKNTFYFTSKALFVLEKIKF